MLLRPNEPKDQLRREGASTAIGNVESSQKEIARLPAVSCIAWLGVLLESALLIVFVYQLKITASFERKES